MSILLVGHKGFLGSTIAIVAKERGIEIIPYEEGATPEGITTIINAAAMTDPKACEADKAKAHASNVELVGRLQKLSHTINAKLIQISTVSVFPCTEGPYRVTDTPDPKNYYSQTKLESEQLLKGDASATVVRINLIGTHPLGGRQTFFEFLLNDLKAGKTIKAFDDVVMNPLSTWTAADLLLDFATKGTPAPLLHLGSKDILSKYDIAIELVKHLELPIDRVVRESMPDDGIPKPKRMWLDVSETERLLAKEMPTLSAEVAKAFEKSGTHTNG